MRLQQPFCEQLLHFQRAVSSQQRQAPGLGQRDDDELNPSLLVLPHHYLLNHSWRSSFAVVSSLSVSLLLRGRRSSRAPRSSWCLPSRCSSAASSRRVFRHRSTSCSYCIACPPCIPSYTPLPCVMCPFQIPAIFYAENSDTCTIMPAEPESRSKSTFSGCYHGF